ncbi:MAG: YfcC family protein [Hyphomonadaceae bacterium]
MNAPDAAAQPRKRSFEFPTAFAILFALIVLFAAATWIVPAGQYERVQSEALGREIAVAGTYRPVQANPQNLIDVFKAPVAGFYDGESGQTRAVDVVLFVLFIGGFMGVVGKTGAMNAAIAGAMRTLSGREKWMIPILTALFALGGTIMGMAEETLPFLALLVPVMMRAGYDSIVAVAIVLGGSTIGALGSTINPFATIIASNAAGIPFTDGLALRLALLATAWLITVAYVMRYAARVKADPARSLVADRRAEIEAQFGASAADPAHIALSLRQRIVLAIFAAAIGAMIWGVATQGWWMMEMTALFLFAAIVAAIAAGMNERAFIDTFVDGAGNLLGVALIIGLARGVLVIMDEGRITDTILHAGEGALSGLSSIAFINMMFGVEALMAFIVPSSSGQAVLTMPILAPLADFAGVERALVVTAFQMGNGVVSLFTPTSAVVMGSLAIGRVPLQRWLQFILPLALILTLICALFLSIAALV